MLPALRIVGAAAVKAGGASVAAVTGGAAVAFGALSIFFCVLCLLGHEDVALAERVGRAAEEAVASSSVLNRVRRELPGRRAFNKPILKMKEIDNCENVMQKVHEQAPLGIGALTRARPGGEVELPSS